MSKRFRVAFSFAGAKRGFISEVARVLAKRFGESAILYDKYHVAEFARSDLAFHLPLLYLNHSDLVVVVLCSDYEQMEWCGLEWAAIFSLIKQRRPGEVMLSRFDRAEGKGLHGLAGFMDLDALSPTQAASHICERLAINEGREAKYYSASLTTSEIAPNTEWPDSAFEIDWPVADHSEARRGFTQLVTRSAQFRLLLIQGESDTGKTHITKQFLGSALQLPNLVCGRLDFKGSSDMTAELLRFAERLGVPAPASCGGTSNQLAEILASLRATSRPTLLIFDTFEMAGDAERWVKESLLTFLVRAPWMRIAIVGQRTPIAHGEPWAAASSPPVRLHPPSPEEWFSYGQPYKAGLTLDFVRKAHTYCAGKSTLMAQLLGPTS